MAEERWNGAEAPRSRCGDGPIEIGPDDAVRLVGAIEDIRGDFIALRTLIEARGHLGRTLELASALRARIDELMADLVQTHVPRCLRRASALRPAP